MKFNLTYRIGINLLLCFLGCAVLTQLRAQEHIVEGFFDEVVSSNYNLPVGIRFDHEGRAFVWEKSGKIYNLSPDGYNKTLILDISEEVASWGDHGMTGVAIDPDFAENGNIYVAYTVDRHYLFNYGTPDYDKDSTILTNATIGRVSKFQLDLNTFPYEVIEGSRKIILGQHLTDGFPILADFHGVGSLAFGNDGSLFVSCGDGGLDSEPNVKYHTDQALRDGIIDSTMIIGSYRAQTIHSLNGKIIRINPETGDGISSNPFYDPLNPRSPQSRIWVMGLRNPYKFIHIPETGSHNPSLGDPGLFISGDIGSSYWEEFNLIQDKGQNFGWPKYEGHHAVWPYGFFETESPFAPNPLFDNADCGRKNFKFTDLIGQDNESRQLTFYNPCSEQNIEIPSEIRTHIQTRPILYYNNVSWNPPVRAYIPTYDQDGIATEGIIDANEIGIGEIFEGYSAIPGSFYPGGSFPDTFANSLFVCDFSGWIKRIDFSDDYKVKTIHDFRSDIKGIVDLTYNHIDDSFYYINILTKEVRRISFGGNPAPIAVAEADTIYGGNSLKVSFDASKSYDPNQLPIDIFWDFGDGFTSKEINPEHEFTSSTNTPTKFKVSLTVTDSLGKVGIDSLYISLNNTPPTVKILSPTAESKYAINGYNRIDFSADVNDKEEANENLKYEWQVHIHHNLHYHSEEPVNRSIFSSLIEPVGCAEIDKFWYRVTLDIEDSYGLKGSDEVLIYPNCEVYGTINWNRYEILDATLQLNWDYSNIPNLDYFLLQKLDVSGNVIDINAEISQVNGAFSSQDHFPEEGDNRYRLKIFTSEGNYYYSSEFTARYTSSDLLLIYPNPSVSKHFNLRLNQPFMELVEIELFDINGRKVFEKIINNTPNLELNTQIYSEELNKGLYILVLKNGDRVFNRKVEIIE